MAQQSEHSAHLIYSAWWNVNIEKLVTQFMNKFLIREIMLTKIFMRRQAIVSSAEIQMIIDLKVNMLYSNEYHLIR